MTFIENHREAKGIVEDFIARPVISKFFLLMAS
jgi:hypothetical protein